MRGAFGLPIPGTHEGGFVQNPNRPKLPPYAKSAGAILTAVKAMMQEDSCGPVFSPEFVKKASDVKDDTLGARSI